MAFGLLCKARGSWLESHFFISFLGVPRKGAGFPLIAFFGWFRLRSTTKKRLTAAIPNAKQKLKFKIKKPKRLFNFEF
ncbi:MAG: hypothetical protein EAY66_01180 [Sphingobacteriales bacterium]|nr:MAG: hypothetical protein EAY66_01180 [Sphingobacteriales bacterium]